MESTSYIAPDIHCEGCANSIRRSLGKLRGVTDVTVDVDAKRVQVTFDDAAVTAADIADRLAAAGFPVAPISI